MYRKTTVSLSRGYLVGADRLLPICDIIASVFLIPEETKISKKSALAVHKNFRDNQQQSVGIFGSALA